MDLELEYEITPLYFCQNCGQEFSKGMYISLKLNDEPEVYCFICNKLRFQIKECEEKLNKLCLKKNNIEQYYNNGFKRRNIKKPSESCPDKRKNVREHFEKLVYGLLQRQKNGDV